jgi:AraC-like DNA-binding protein
MAPLPFLFGPLLWLYVREIGLSGGIANGNPIGSRGFRISALAHLLPYFVGVCVLTIPVVVLREGEYQTFIRSIFAAQAPLWFNLQNVAKVVVNLIYVGITIRTAFGQFTRGLSRGRRLWLRALAIAPIPSLLFYAYIAIRPEVSAELAGGNNLPFALLAVAMALLVYTLSMLVLLCPDVPKRGGDQSPNGHLTMSDEECRAVAGGAWKELESGAYRDPEISLARLAATLEVHPNRLSLALNRTYGRSFPSLVNQQRVNYFLSRAEVGALETRSILDLALDSGFSAKSTFNRVFKEQVGVSPSRYYAGKRAAGSIREHSGSK